MKAINTKSLLFKSIIAYIFVTILNVTIFNMMVYENQTDLIRDNAILSSQYTASTFKYHIDNALVGDSGLTVTAINKIIKEGTGLGVKNMALFSEAGQVFVDIKENQLTDKKIADAQDLKMINMSITKRSFEDRLFYHHVNKKNKTIDLYIPFTYETGKLGVAFIRLEMKGIDTAMGYLLRQCILIAIILIIIHFIFAMIISKMILIPLRNLFQATMEISSGKLDIRVPIVSDDEIGRLASAFNEMSIALQRMQNEAKGANPLTGLPGNISIAQYIDDNLVKSNMIAVLYCDLDNFKAYNDKYGFSKGDDAILYTRDCLVQTSKRKDVCNVFVGHEGGDDFVVICDYDCWEVYVNAFITTFDRGIYQFYNSVDARNGFIESVNRKGEPQRFPLMSISIAVVNNKTRPFTRHAEMIQIAAEVKKVAKSMDGSCYAVDRRNGPVGGDPHAPATAQSPSRPPVTAPPPPPVNPALQQNFNQTRAIPAQQVRPVQVSQGQPTMQQPQQYNQTGAFPRGALQQGVPFASPQQQPFQPPQNTQTQSIPRNVVQPPQNRPPQTPGAGPFTAPGNGSNPPPPAPPRK